ncbi:F-box/FBD/LRR-repeat protein At1g13570-like [Apium graveolens]|uniref:F-box/FBD/LRR-repeat protein At1g13570-like n=1 Tax=Apium graveolens TaxID=4045 RepID=UPI003D7BBA26
MSRIAKPRQSESGTAAIDRISSLPGNVIDNILERLPIHDAASTSVLSKTWRDLWDLYPNLVFDWVFFSRIVANNDTLDEENLISEVTGTINEILLGNPGPILKFHLSVPEDLPLHETPNMDLWIKNISNNRVRQLKLIIGPLTAYKIPSYLFSCSELTHLSLTNCLLNPPLRFGGFCNLIDVTLENVIITGDMSFGTQLKELKLRFCSGIEHLESQFKQNHHLITFLIHKSGEIDLKWFECTKKLRTLGLLSEKGADSRKSYINLEKLLGNMIEIRTIHFNGSFLKLLESSAAVSKRLITTTRKLSLYKVEFYDLVQIRHVLFLMRSFPKLQRLEIIVKKMKEEVKEGKLKVEGTNDVLTMALVSLSTEAEYVVREFM